MSAHILFVDPFDGLHPGHEHILTSIVQPLLAERKRAVECSFLVCSDVMSGTQYRFSRRERVALANVLARGTAGMSCDVHECDMTMPEVVRYSWTHPGQTVSIISMSDSEVLQFLRHQRPDAETTRRNPPIIEPVFIEQRSLAMSTDRPNTLPNKTLQFSYIYAPGAPSVPEAPTVAAVPLLPVPPAQPVPPTTSGAAAAHTAPSVHGAAADEVHFGSGSTRGPHRTPAAVSGMPSVASITRREQRSVDAARSNGQVRAHASPDTPVYEGNTDSMDAESQPREGPQVRVVDILESPVLLTIDPEIIGLLRALRHHRALLDRNLSGEQQDVDVSEEGADDATATAGNATGGDTDEEVSL